MEQNDDDESNDLKKPYKFQKVAGLYNIGRTIGRGHYAVVKEACHVITQEKVAIKIIDKTQLDQCSREQLLSEVMCMKLVQHPNIVRLYEVIDTVSKLYLILELGDGGDLYDYIINNGSQGLSEEEAKRYFRQILRAIGYCHKLHVVHRDIKPENVVFFSQLELVKLTDFGFSNKFVPGGTLSTSCGSLAYSAPEILLGDSYDAPKVDIWSLGVILFMLVVGSLPFNETNDSETVARIMDCKYTIPGYVSAECQQLIGRMLVREAANRASLDDIIEDSWLAVDVNDVEYELENYSIPLLNQEQLTFEEHLEILSRMSEEKLATVEEIQRYLDDNEYNHVSATYFLLAERKLKRRFVEEYVELKARHNNSKKVDVNNTEKQKQNIVNQSSFDSTRRISMILEGEENEENEAINSLAVVRRQLDEFLPEINQQESLNIGVLNSSRCVSRINSVIDLHSLSDDYDNDSDAGSLVAVVRSRKKLRSINNYRSSSPINNNNNNSNNSFVMLLNNNNNNKNNNIDGPIIIDKEKKERKCLTHNPMMLNQQIVIIKKSYSVTDLSERKEMGGNIWLDKAKNNVHKFSNGSNTARVSSSSAKYLEMRKMALNERRSNQVFFDTGSNSTTANGSSAENSDMENDNKLKVKKSKKKIEKQMSDFLDNREICQPIDEEDEINKSRNTMSSTKKKFNNDCYRSQSFDGRLRNNVQLDGASLKGVLSRKAKCKSPSNSWHRNSLCHHLADSNFSLTSLASRLDNPNVMQVIRGMIELRLQSYISVHEPVSSNSLTKQTTETHIEPSPSVVPPTCSNKDTSHCYPKPRNFYKHLRTTIPKFKKQKLYILKSRSISKSPFLEHSSVSSSNSCHVLSPKDKIKDMHSIHNSNSIPQLSSSNYSDHRANKTDDLFNKKGSLTCCILS